jgi:hypothetical protein
MMSLRGLQARRGINTPLHAKDVEFWAITKGLARERQLLIYRMIPKGGNKVNNYNFRVSLK